MLTIGGWRRSPVVIEASRDEYAARFVLRSRRRLQDLSAERRTKVLLAWAEQLERWALEVREEAESVD